MKTLELFSGSGRMASHFKDKGYETFTIDNNRDFKEHTDLIIDILDVTPEMIIAKFGYPDVIWASPPCTAFSVASIGHHWTGGKGAYIPKTEFAELSKKIVLHTIWLIEQLTPRSWFIENPRGVLRKMPFMIDLPRYTITYCQYGDNRMKPTDIWSNYINPDFKAMCKNGDPCHIAAPRGSRTGTQGLKNKYERSLIPYEFCNYIASLDYSYKKVN